MMSLKITHFITFTSIWYGIRKLQAQLSCFYMYLDVVCDNMLRACSIMWIYVVSITRLVFELHNELQSMRFFIPIWVTQDSAISRKQMREVTEFHVTSVGQMELDVEQQFSIIVACSVIFQK